MTEEQLAAIEAIAGSAVENHDNEMARSVCRSDVPALVAEVRRLRELARAVVKDGEHVTLGNRWYCMLCEVESGWADRPVKPVHTPECAVGALAAALDEKGDKS